MWVHRYGFGGYRYRSSWRHPPQTRTHATGQAGSVPIWAWSVSHFEQGRWGLLEGKEPLRLAFRAREGDGSCWKEKNPSVSHFKRGRGGGWLEGNGPLHLAFRVREGRGVVGRKRPPPSRISSEGGEGVGWKETAPFVSHFEQGRFTRRTCVSINII